MVVGTQDSSAVFLTMDERKSKFCHILKRPSRSAEAVEQGIRHLREIYGALQLGVSFNHQ